MWCCRVKDYLQSLNKKPTTASLQWDKFGEISDLSADDDFDTDKQPWQQQTKVVTDRRVTSSSKFMKKKVSSQPDSLVTSDKQQMQLPSKADTHRGASVSTLGNASVRSSALGKAQSFAAKYNASRVAAEKVTTLSSDSDLDMSLSPPADAGWTLRKFYSSDSWMICHHSSSIIQS